MLQGCQEAAERLDLYLGDQRPLVPLRLLALISQSEHR
jgi:hypothetical protein